MGASASTAKRPVGAPPSARRGPAIDGKPEMDSLAALAQQMLERAYAPYSRFRVGAAIEAEDGRRFGGCNIENRSYGTTICAERTALFSAVAAGARRFRCLALTTDAPLPMAPCGICRQALNEFAPDLDVISTGAAGGEQRWTMRELLPEAFDARLP